MADASSTLIAVLVGGGLTILSGWLGPYLLERQKATERKQRRAQKFEELVTALYDFDHWLDNLRDVRAYGIAHPEQPSPFAKVEAIAAVYFPQMLDRIAAVDRAATSFVFWTGEAGQRRLAGQGLNEGAAEAYQPYVQARQALLDDLRGLGRAGFVPKPRLSATPFVVLCQRAISRFRNSGGS